MNWLKNLFGVGEPAPAQPSTKQPAQPAQPPARVEKTLTPGSIARMFAKDIPGAIIDNFDGGNPRDDGLVARVTFTHEGTVLRIVMRRYDIWESVVWLETRCVGTFGDFNLQRVDPKLDEACARMAGRATKT